MQLPSAAFASLGGGQCYCPRCLEKAMGVTAEKAVEAALEK